MEPSPLRMGPGLRRTLQVTSVILIVAGVVLFGSLLVLASEGDPGAWFPARAFGGVLMLGLGSMLARLAFLRPVSELVATETEVALRHGGRSVAQGAAEGLTGAPYAVPGTVVKVRCRSCGFLDTEDARFCSSCGKGI